MFRKKLDLLQRWAAGRVSRKSDAVDAPISWVGPDEVEAYVVHLRERGLSDTSRKNHLSIIRSFFDTLNRRLDLTDPTRKLDEVRFHQSAPNRSFLTRREADMLLGTMENATEFTEQGSADAREDAVGDNEHRGGTQSTAATNRHGVLRALAARDHAAFSTMIYAGLRIEETTTLTVEDLSFSRGSEELRVDRGKGNKERVVPMGPRLRRSLRRYLRHRDALVPAEVDSPLPHLL